jgi:hypothetical protein
MASSTGQKIASPQIYTSDPIEQGFAKQVLDPDMGGLAYAFMNAAHGDRQRNQASYMDALRESNMMAARLAAHEADQELLGKALTSAAEMANAGIDPNLMPVNQKLYGANFGSQAVGLPSSLSRDVKLSQAEKNRADAAHARSGGADGGVKITNTQDYGSSGVVGDTRVVITGKDQAAVDRAVAADKAARAKPPPGGPGAPATTTTIRPDGTVGPKTTAELRAESRDGQLITQRLNERDAKYRDR